MSTGQGTCGEKQECMATWQLKKKTSTKCQPTHSHCLPCKLGSAPLDCLQDVFSWQGQWSPRRLTTYKIWNYGGRIKRNYPPSYHYTLPKSDFVNTCSTCCCLQGGAVQLPPAAERWEKTAAASSPSLAPCQRWPCKSHTWCLQLPGGSSSS